MAVDRDEEIVQCRHARGPALDAAILATSTSSRPDSAPLATSRNRRHRRLSSGRASFDSGLGAVGVDSVDIDVALGQLAGARLERLRQRRALRPVGTEGEHQPPLPAQFVERAAPTLTGSRTAQESVRSGRRQAFIGSLRSSFRGSDVCEPGPANRDRDCSAALDQPFLDRLSFLDSPVSASENGDP